MIQYDVLNGQDETLCIKCSNGDDDLSFDRWKVSQKPFDCPSQITTEALSDITYDYDAGATDASVIEPASMFTIKDEVNCPLKECKLLSKDCSETLPENEFLTISEKSPFSISTVRNSAAGYSLKACLVCQFGKKDGDVLYTYTQKDWTVSQLPKISCGDIILPSTSQQQRVIMEYDSKVSKSYSFINFFDNSSPLLCKIDSCEIM